MLKNLSSGLLIVLMVSVIGTTMAQSRWKAYDSILYENLFLPNFSNLLMPKGYVEVLVSNSLLTANAQWDPSNGSKFSLDRRLTNNYTTAIANLGVSRTNRFNLGVEVHYGTAYHDSDPNSPAMNVFKGSSPGYVYSGSALTSVGPRIKFRPVARNRNFVIISTVQLPLYHDAIKENYLGSARTQLVNQFLYSFTLGKKFAFFAEDDLYIYFKEGNNSYNTYYNGATLYSYWLVTKYVFPFASVGYAGIYGTDANTKQFGTVSQIVPVGLGLQVQFSLRFNINAYYSQYAWGSNYNDWRTLNVGFRGVF